MPRAHRYSEKQIVLALQEVESGARGIDEVCRRLGIHRRTFYKWRDKFGGMDASEVMRLRSLEDENRRLKHAVADLTLDNQLLREVVQKKF
jgi:putative transposase